MSGAARVDPQPPDPGWPSPAELEPTLVHPGAEAGEPEDTGVTPFVPRRRGPLIVGAVVLALALLAAGLWAAGAFRERTDRGRLTGAGTTISTGPYEMAFSKVTVQKKKGYSDSQPSYVARVLGTGRTTGDESIEPDAGDRGMFALRDEKAAVVYEPTGLRWGSNDRIGDGSGFTPGLPAVPFTVEFKLPSDYVPAATLTFAVFDLELRDNSLLGNQEPGWHNAYHYSGMALPVQRLPDDIKS